MILLSIDTCTRRVRRYDELRWCSFNGVLSALPTPEQVDELRRDPIKALRLDEPEDQVGMK